MLCENLKRFKGKCFKAEALDSFGEILNEQLILSLPMKKSYPYSKCLAL